jgi:6-phosphogluconolactonase
VEVVVLDDPAGEAAERLVAAAGAGGHVALAGGSTPRAAYERAADAGADWSGATLWYGDERCVAPDDPRSNHAMVREALLERLAGPAPRVVRMEGERGAEEAAARYEVALREALGDRPRLDLVLLGLGADGHCASLFPGKPAVDERERLAVGVPEAGLEPWVPRVTLTFPVLNDAREVVVLVSGESKADAVAGAFGPAPDPALPAALVRPDPGRLTLLLDPAAGARLEA